MRILFITNASHTPSQNNYNHFQRVDFLSRHADLTLWARKGSDFTASAKPGTSIMRASFGGKLGLFLQVLINSLSGRARHFDIVLTEPSLLSVTGLMCKMFGTKKWVVDVWDIPGRVGGKRGILAYSWLRLNRIILRQAFRYADLFLLSIRPDYEFAYFGIPPDRTLNMKNAIRLKEFQCTNASHDSRSGFNILCTRSAYHSDMGLDTLAAAYEILRGKDAKFSLTIVGRIPDSVRPQISSLERDPTVEFADFLDQAALKMRITQADVCVVPFKDVPDLAQTYPIKVVEYMATRKPVIVSAIGGMSEIIQDGETGLLFQAGNAADLAAKIELLQADPEFAAKLADNAAEASVAYDYTVKGEKILEALGGLFTR